MRLPRGAFAFSFAFLFYKVKRILPRGAVVSHVRGLFKRLGCGTAQTDLSGKNREGVGWLGAKLHHLNAWTGYHVLEWYLQIGSEMCNSIAMIIEYLIRNTEYQKSESFSEKEYPT